MTVLLVLSTLVLFLAIDFFLEKARAARARAEAFRPSAAGQQFIIPGEVQLAMNHTWMKEEKGVTTIGLDEFLSRMLGTVEAVLLPDVGDAVTPVTVNIALCDGDRSVQLAAPVVGSILEVNTKVLKDPGLAFRDPYGSGWLLRVKEHQRRQSDSRFMRGAGAADWLKRQTELAKEFLAGVTSSPALATLQDGGSPSTGVLRQCDARVWKEFERRFTGIAATDQATN